MVQQKTWYNMLTLPRVKKRGRVPQRNGGHPNESQNWGVNGGSHDKVHPWLGDIQDVVELYDYHHTFKNLVHHKCGASTSKKGETQEVL